MVQKLDFTSLLGLANMNETWDLGPHVNWALESLLCVDHPKTHLAQFIVSIEGVKAFFLELI